jgi:hypothetical protein
MVVCALDLRLNDRLRESTLPDAIAHNLAGGRIVSHEINNGCVTLQVDCACHPEGTFPPLDSWSFWLGQQDAKSVPWEIERPLIDFTDYAREIAAWL